MRRMSVAILSGLILFVAACAAPPASQPAAAAGRSTLFEGARLITGDEAPPIEDSAFVVQDGTFTSVGRRGQVQAPDGAARVDLTGKTVMPGIIEAHAHLGYWKDLKPSAENFTRENVLSDLQRLAYHGVTAVLSMGADRREIAWPFRDELRANPRPDAAMYLSAGGLAMPTGGPFSPLREAVRVVTNEEDVRKEIQELVAKKADFIKVWQDSRRELMPRPVVEFLIAEAHRTNLRVVAHTHALSDFKHLLRSGLDAFVHPTWRQTEVEPVDDELIALFKAHPNVPVMPGFWTPRNEIYGARPYWLDDPLLAETFTQAEIKALENAKTPSDAPQTWASGPVPRSMKRLKAAGVRFVLGTDMGGGFSLEHDPTPAYLGWSTHIEMESMVKAGLTPREVITAATRDSAQFLGIDQLGMVASGKHADFLVLDANPLDNIANTRRVSRVYVRGGEVDRAALRKHFSGGPWK
ncbi:MAG: amidohydrolase family protein [Vicinamibacterales bacterium]